jgi:hypothetical protein
MAEFKCVFIMEGGIEVTSVAQYNMYYINAYSHISQWPQYRLTCPSCFGITFCFRLTQIK